MVQCSNWKSKIIFFIKEIKLSTLAWTIGQQSWLPINDMPALKAVLVAKPRGVDDNQNRQDVRSERFSVTRFGFGRQPSISSAVPQSLFSISRKRVTSNEIWEEKLTIDRVPYYYNTSTDAVSWDKPDSLKSHEEKLTDSHEWVWISDETEGWIPAMVKNKAASGQVTVATTTGIKRSFWPNEREPMWSLKLSSLTRLEDDLVMIDDLNPGLMVHILKERYTHDQIYTWVGASHNVLVSINPFKQLPIYTATIMKEISKPSPNRLDAPHTFAIANSSYIDMRINARNQAILISGESGAGKTEATKQCFSYLAEVAGSELGLEQKILNAIPILEAFGNAKTLRNDNSSRFGRWTEIHFSARGQITCASIENYLLEKTRVVFQSMGERNYHIFYQVIIMIDNI